MRAAASSIASGRPSTRRTISATAGSRLGVQGRNRAGWPARARRRAGPRRTPRHPRHSPVPSSGSGCDRKLAFAGDPEPGPAGDEQRHPGAGIDQRAQPRRRDHHLLEVVQHEEQASIGDGRQQAIVQRLGAHVAQSKATRDGVQDEVGVADRGEIDEDDPIRRSRARPRRRPRSPGASCRRRQDRSGSGGGRRDHAPARQRRPAPGPWQSADVNGRGRGVKPPSVKEPGR